MVQVDGKVLDELHLELGKPIGAPPGTPVRISIEIDTDEHQWQKAGKKTLLASYAEEDAVYDKL